MREPNESDIYYAVEQTKSEIAHDIRAGIVPPTVSSFSELHDYVDANEYGGLCEGSSVTGVDWLAEHGTYSDNHANTVQCLVDAWLKSGGAHHAI